VSLIQSGVFGDAHIFAEIVDCLSPSKDFYLVGEDFASYLDAHNRAVATFQDKSKWAKMSILSTAGMGKFSSDRAVHEYATKIWHTKQITYPNQ